MSVITGFEPVTGTQPASTDTDTASRPTSHADDPGYEAGVRRALRIAALGFASVLTAVQVARMSAVSESYTSLTPVFAMCFVHGLVWVAVLFWRRMPSWSIALSLAGVMLAHVLSVATVTDDAVYLTLATGVNAVLVAGLVLPFRVAVPVVVVLTGANTVLLISARDIDPTLTGLVVQVPMYMAASGAVSIIVVRVLVRVARAADLTTMSRRAADARTATQSERERRAREVAWTLHDSVINTLAALSSGRIVSDRAVVRARCTQDIETLDLLLAQDGTPPNDPVSALHRRADLEGLDLAIPAADVARLRALLEAQPVVEHAPIEGLLGEVMTNAAKHGAHRVQVSVDREGAIAVTDDGPSLDPAGPQGGRLQSTLQARVAGTGVGVGLATAPGQGLTVTVTVDGVRPSELPVYSSAATAMATGLVVVDGLLFAGVTVVTAPTAAVSPTVLALVTFLAASVLTLRTTRGGFGVPPSTLAAVGLAMVAVTLLPGVTQDGCARVGTYYWGFDAVNVLVWLLVLLDGRRAVVVAAVAASLILTLGLTAFIDGSPLGCGGGPFTIEVQNLLAVAIYLVLRRALVRLCIVVEEQSRSRQRTLVDAERRSQFTADVREALSQVLVESREVLMEVARDPERTADPSLKATAVREESYLRVLVGLVPSTAILSVVALIENARTRGVSLSATGQSLTLRQDEAAVLLSAVDASVAACSSGQHVTVGLYGGGGMGTLLVVSPSGTQTAPPTVPHGYEVATWDDGSRSTLEMRWARS